MMKRIVSLCLSLIVMMSCVSFGTDAQDISETESSPYLTYAYCPVTFSAYGLPKLIRATFTYDAEHIELLPDYPGYNGTGVSCPLTQGAFGELFDFSCTVEENKILCVLTLKDGYELDDYLDILDRNVVESGYTGFTSRAKDKRRTITVMEMAFGYKDNYAGLLVRNQPLDVVLEDGTVLCRDGVETGSFSLYSGSLRKMPAPEPPAPVYKYQDKLVSQYGIDQAALTSYDEIYEHTADDGTVDWALVKAETTPVSTPFYHEFGNRVISTESSGAPFACGIGVYSAAYDRFFDLEAPELYEFDGLERVWTQMGTGRLIGDMNGDDSLDVDDAALIQRCQAQMDDYPENDRNDAVDSFSGTVEWFSDFDRDSDRDITDTSAIQRFLAELPYRPEGWKPYVPIEPTEPSEPEPTEPEPTEPEPTELEPTECDSSIPRIIGFKSTGRGVEMNLSTVAGAEKYRVYYKDETGSWTKIGETDDNTFIHSSVKTGTTYCYTVRCIKADLSAFTSDFYRPGWSYTYAPQLDTPQITRIEAVNEGAKITWAPVEGADLYRVYRSSNNRWVKIADTRDTSCIYTTVDYTMMTFTVRCLSPDGTGFASDYDRDGESFNLLSTPYINNLEAHLDGVSFYVDGEQDVDVAVYRMENKKWKRIDVVPSQSRYIDTDVVPGNSYTYTVRCLSDDGSRFTSRFNTKGWTQSFTVEECIPELEFVIFNGENMALVQAKEGNLFDIPYFAINFEFAGDYLGTFIINGDEPMYIRDDNIIKQNKSYRIYVIGLDENKEPITKYHESGYDISFPALPVNFRVKKIGDRRYRFRWDGDHNKYQYMFCLSDDDTIDVEEKTPYLSYDIDLSDYPENMELNAYVYAVSKDELSASMPVSLKFRESDYSD